MSHPILQLQLLGGFNLVYDRAPITAVNSARLQSLLAHLVLHADAPQSRQHLASLFWPDTAEPQARNNLRQFLYQLRQALPDTDRFLAVDTHTVYWKMDAEQSIDVASFRRCLNDAHAAEQRGDLPESGRHFEKGILHYSGDLLPDCYEDWITPERDQLRQQYRDACAKLISILEADREYAAALLIAQRLHRSDPLDERACVSLIRLHGLNEDRTGARHAYQIAVETLKREADLEPSAELEAAFQRSQRAPRLPSRSDDSASLSSAYRLVGRQAEWQQLQAAWQRAAGGKAHLCLIAGEAGIGKSRLAEELFQDVTHQGFTTAHTRSYGREGSLSLAPLTEWLRSPAVGPYLNSLAPVWRTELARLLPELLTEDTALPRPEPIAEYGRRQRFFEALAHGVLAAPQPLLLWIDDLQWCDPETLDWLHFLLRFQSHRPVLLLGTVRSEESPPDHPLSVLTRQLQTESRVEMIDLLPFDATETSKLAALVQGDPLDDIDSVRLYRETEGNPLFVVEAVRAGLTSAAAAPSAKSPSLTPRVQAIIAGRLAQLSPAARSVAETGAAIGRAFTLELLLAGHESEEAVIHALDELWQRRIVREQSANVFDFTHDKLREVTYAEISLPQRRSLHRRIAQALEVLNAEALDPISAQVAAHYEQAGLIEKAIPYYQRAGSVAAGVYANEDAIHLFNRGLKLLGQLPPSVKRDIQELNIQLELATLYRMSKGWASPEEERVIHRAMVLSDKVGDVEQRIRTLFGQLTLSVVQAQYDRVEWAHAQAMKLFQQTQSTPPPFAEIFLAGTKLLMGSMVEGREQFEKSIAVRDDKHIRDLQESQDSNYLVHGLAWNAHGLWCLGYPQSALQGAEDAVVFAREFAQPFNQALAITYQATLHAWQADTATLLVHAENACALTAEYKAPYYHAWANILLRFAQAEQQPDTETLSRLRSAIHTFTETGARIRLPLYFSLLAQVCLKGGRLEEGQDALEQALAESLQNNEHWWDAEIHRLRGELLWAQGAAPTDIEVAFQRAREIAQSQQAKSLELRAATSLTRFWQAQQRSAEARRCLTDIYAWFTEGFDTPDLQAANALIARL